MNKDILLKPATAWDGGIIAERLDNCRSMLFCHGFITMRENDRIFAKLNKLYASAIEARSVAPVPVAAEGESAAAESRDAHNSSAELYFSKGGVK